MNEVPFFIEGSNSNFSATLFDLAWEISSHVNYANSQERRELHLAAVWVNNFTNHLIHIAKEYLERKDIDFAHLNSKSVLKELTLQSLLFLLRPSSIKLVGI
mgnify:CR=1 FL=1